MKTFILTLLFIYSPLMANTDLQNQRSQSINTVFNTLSKDTMHLVDEFYDPNVDFQDPVGKIKGSAAIKKYYENMYKNVQSIRFDFHKEVVTGDAHVVMWTMHVTAKNLNGGKSVAVEGNSHIVFGPNNKVIYHRDYFDMGEFLYEHIPVLGYAIKKIKALFEHKNL
jgi:ketosteroid isomerase-like protein